MSEPPETDPGPDDTKPDETKPDALPTPRPGSTVIGSAEILRGAVRISVEEVAAFLLPQPDLYAEEGEAARPSAPRRTPLCVRVVLPAGDDGPALALTATLDAGDVRNAVVTLPRAAPPRQRLAARLAAVVLLMTHALPCVRVCEEEGDEEEVNATAVAWLTEAVRGVRRRAAARAAWRQTRDASILALSFPFAEYRPSQHALARETFRALRDGHPLLAEAPTGSGKTVAVLFGALMGLGHGHVDRLMVATARGTGRLAPAQALAALRAGGLRLRSVVIGAKEDVCAQPGAACPTCPLGKGYFLRLPAALDAAWTQAEGLDLPEMAAVAQSHAVCPFELSLDLGAQADLLIGDYNYVFSPFVALQRLFGERVGLLVDEAHNLEDRVRALLSPHFALAVLTPWVEKAAARDAAGPRHQNLLALRDQVAALLDGSPGEGVLPPEPVRALRAVLRPLVPLPTSPDPADHALRETAVLGLAALDALGETHVALAQPGKSLTLLCLDPSRHIRSVLAKARGAILFSATLSPADHFRQVLGLGATGRALRFAAPTPPGSLRVLVHDGLDLRYRHRQTTAAPLAALLARFITAQPGTTLVYFPSYAYLDAIALALRTHLSERPLIAQSRTLSPEERLDILARLARRERPVGLLVMGGILAESIELPEGVLSGVAIVSLGLPGVSAERAALSAHYDRVFGSGRGFDHAYTYPGLRRVVQAAGRLIRRPGDRGSLLLVDRRFTDAPALAILPKEWDKTRISTEDMESHLKVFWEGGFNR